MTAIYGFVLGYDLIQGARVPLTVGIVSAYFGLRSLGELIGLLTGVSMMAGAVALVAAGVVYDKSGSYLPATTLSVVCFVVAGLLILLIKSACRSTMYPLLFLLSGNAGGTHAR